MLVIIVKAIILITILCNDGKQDQKKKKGQKYVIGVKKQVSQLWKWQKVFSSHAGHL